MLNIDIHCACFPEALKGVRTLFSKVLNKHVEHFQPWVDVSNYICLKKYPKPKLELVQYLEFLGSVQELAFTFCNVGLHLWVESLFTSVFRPVWWKALWKLMSLLLIKRPPLTCFLERETVLGKCRNKSLHWHCLQTSLIDGLKQGKLSLQWGK